MIKHRHADDRPLFFPIDPPYRLPFIAQRVMDKNRLEAFSDGVLAIIITIMVLEMKVPHDPDLAALKPVLPVFLTYVLSYIYVGIYWNNHHHLLKACRRERRDYVGQPQPAVLVIIVPVCDGLDGREPFYAGALSLLRSCPAHGCARLLYPGKPHPRRPGARLKARPFDRSRH